MSIHTDFTDKQAVVMPATPAFEDKWIGPVTMDFTGKTITATDVWQALGVLAAWRVLKTNTKIIKAAVGSALTANIGDGGGNSKYGAAMDLTAAAGTEYESAVGTDAGVAGGDGTLYTVADTVDIEFPTVTAVTGNPIIAVRALVRIPYTPSGYKSTS